MFNFSILERFCRGLTTLIINGIVVGNLKLKEVNQLFNLGISSIEKAEELASKHFGLSLPFTIKQLKSAYRRRSLELHPDKTGGSDEPFKEMKQGYEYLVSLEEVPEIFVNEDMNSREAGFGFSSSRIALTYDGIPLSQLGLGLGQFKNGVDCPECGHDGFVLFHQNVEIPEKLCANCGGEGFTKRTVTCHRCQGRGRVSQRGSRRSTTCLDCFGSGRYTNYDISRCTLCSGNWQRSTTRLAYRVCTQCKGSGEIPIYNPVIPKGRLLR